MRTLLQSLLILLGVPLVTASERVALVIGCSNYAADPNLKLDTPLNDMRDFKRTLESEALGFSVISVPDATREKFDSGLRAFNNAARNAKVAMVFFSGHGLEYGGHNYLITTNATLDSADMLPTETMPLDVIIASLKDTKATVKMAILDCCRNSFFASTPEGTKTKSWRATKGIVDERVLRALGDAEIPEATLLCFATSAGRQAAAVLDESSSRSPFTDLLIKELTVPGQSLRDIFEHIHDTLKVQTEGRQVPTVQTDNALSEVFRSTVLVKPLRASTLSAPARADSPQVRATPQAGRPSSSDAQVTTSVRPSTATTAPRSTTSPNFRAQPPPTSGGRRSNDRFEDFTKNFFTR